MIVGPFSTTPVPWTEGLHLWKEEDMQYVIRNVTRNSKTWATVFAVAATVGMVNMSAARADEAQAKSLFKAMSDYMAAQKAISFEYDTNLEVVTKQNQKLGLAS